MSLHRSGLLNGQKLLLKFAPNIRLACEATVIEEVRKARILPVDKYSRVKKVLSVSTTQNIKILPTQPSSEFD